MRKSFAKTILVALAALGLSAAVVAPPAPAEAVMRHGGFGGWHGGGWGGGWRGAYWNGGYRRGYWGGGYYGGWYYPWWGWAPYTVYAYPDYYYPDYGCWVYRRVWDAHHRYLGRRLVNICM